MGYGVAGAAPVLLRVLLVTATRLLPTTAAWLFFPQPRPPHNSCAPSARRRLEVKGEDGEEAVLCSQAQTFSLKTVETTNSVWLVRPDQVCACFA